MPNCESHSGYLDVKISSRSRRGLTPWKAWQKQWCEIKRLDGIENGIHVVLKSSEDGSVLSSIVLPRCATICRTESRTKRHAFGIFSLRKKQKPLLFLSGSSENESQEWMGIMRKMLCIASYLPVGDQNFHVSLIDNLHSRKAGLIGLFGVLSTDTQEITIRDPCTGQARLSWKWYHFHQFHLQAPSHPVDDKMVIVMHTSGEFLAGPGQLYLYCKEGTKLLNQLVARGKRPKNNSSLAYYKRLSRSEGDLCCSNKVCTPDSPLCFRSQTGSDDSGVGVSLTADESGYVVKSKTASSLINMGMALLTKTPGGSETNDDSCQDLLDIEEQAQGKGLPRRDSGLSLASGIYEEISEEIPKTKTENTYCNHIYENPLDVFEANAKLGKHCKPPPLPPRQTDIPTESYGQLCGSPGTKSFACNLYKQRCNTLPAKDFSKMSQMFTAADNEYVVMSPSKAVEKTKSKIMNLTESFYVPMSPVITLKNKIESCYMSMNGKRNN